MHWFSGDTHHSHKNIMKYSARPFSSVEEMDDVLIANINKLVKPNDTFIHLGDYGFGYPQDIVKQLNRVACKNRMLIFGNHDKEIRKNFNFFQRYFPLGMYDYKEVNYNNQFIVLSHYAFRVFNRSHYGSWNLYGHSHGSLTDDPNALSLDVGVDTELYGHERFTPYSFDEIKYIMDNYKTFRSIDHYAPRGKK